MAPVEVAETVHLRSRIDGTGNDSFEAAANLGFESFDQRMSRLAGRYHEHSRVGIEIVKILADAENASLIVDMPLEGFGDGRFAQCVEENGAGSVAHRRSGLRDHEIFCHLKDSVASGIDRPGRQREMFA